LVRNALLQAARTPPPLQPLEREENNHDADGGVIPNPEGSRERAEPRIENNVIPAGPAPPPPMESERRLQQMVLDLDAKYDILSRTMDQKRDGKESLVDNLFQNKESIFTDEVSNFDLPGRFKVPDISIFSGSEDPVEHLDNFSISRVFAQDTRCNGVLSLSPHLVRKGPRLAQEPSPKID
jgi:hypothetical protein